MAVVALMEFIFFVVLNVAGLGANPWFSGKLPALPPLFADARC
jgi:hypothetical protein